jgi:N-acetylglucosaminyl-diphospho-decaprenol L-rhamnosyltransferase
MNYSSNDLTIIIVLFEESKDLVFNCLKNIQNFKIIIIDNANDTNLKKEIEKKFKIEKYLLSKKNIGFTKAANQAIKLCETEYILNINADCFIQEKDIINLIKSHKNYKNCFITSPTFYDDNLSLAYNAGTFDEKKLSKEALNLEGDVCVDKVLGSAILFKKKDMEDLNFLDENFFIFFEDDDLCKKAKNKGMSVIQTFDAKAKHLHGQSKVKNILKRTFLRNYHFTYDQLYYYHKIGQGEKYSVLKKKIKNYFIKMFINFLILNLSKSIYYFSIIKAFYDFKKLMNFIPKKNKQ